MPRELKIDFDKLTKPLHEKWSEYTNQEHQTIKKAKCQKCLYSMTWDSAARSSGRFTTGICCGYEILTHKVRPTRPELCKLHLITDPVDIDILDEYRTMSPKRKIVREARKRVAG